MRNSEFTAKLVKNNKSAALSGGFLPHGKKRVSLILGIFLKKATSPTKARIQAKLQTGSQHKEMVGIRRRLKFSSVRVDIITGSFLESSHHSSHKKSFFTTPLIGIINSI